MHLSQLSSFQLFIQFRYFLLPLTPLGGAHVFGCGILLSFFSLAFLGFVSGGAQS